MDDDHQQNEDYDHHHLHDDDDKNSDIEDDVQVGHKMSKRGQKLTSQLKDDDFIVEHLPSEIGRKMLPRFIPISTSTGVSYMQALQMEQGLTRQSYNQVPYEHH